MKLISKIKKRIEYWRKGIKVWKYCNVYPTAKLGYNVNIGSLTEVGHAVVIGNDVRIGSGCFLCEGVHLGDGAFLGAHVTFTNDKYPPSPRPNWQETFVGRNAAIGANTSIVCGITIGEGSKIGAGSVVTKDVPAGQIWAGNPAKRLREI